VCASDAHGTPTMLRAEQEGISPEALIDRVSGEHRRDFATFRISVDNYVTTHAPANAELTNLIYERLAAGGPNGRKAIKQAYDEQKGMFLPDRYVRGTCPNCGAQDQYGDSCENCAATYSPLDLKDAVSVVSGTAPSVRESEHLFFRLANFEQELREWVPRHIDAALARKLDEWFEAGLRDWDISRDPPYFGFPIPGERDKFFYVWFDAPVGYMASFLDLCRKTGLDFDAYWGADSKAELYHFIGKDISYFHSLFWPAMLSGAGFRRPTGIFAHGFLTVDGQKMSKRRGTFIPAATFARHLDPDYLRYYYASKLGPSVDDIDLSFADFVAKANSDLVGKLVNIASRCAGFVHRFGGGVLADALPDQTLFAEFAAAAHEIGEAYEQRQYARAMRRIMALADRANQSIDER
jgi:methionyl-tRNA synthetase